jgi:hypothetical protein
MHSHKNNQPPGPPSIQIPKVLSDDVPLVVSRQVLSLFAAEAHKLPADVHRAVATQ